MNINKRVSKMWSQYKNYRQLRSYYRSQFDSSGGGKYILLSLLFLVGSIYVLSKAATFLQVLPQLMLIIVVLIISLQIISYWEIAKLKKLCRERTREVEFGKRVDKTSPAEILLFLRERIVNYFKIDLLEVKDQSLEGIYKGEKLGLYYRHLEQDEVLQTQEMIALLRECKQKGITQVRVFVNTDFSAKAKGLGERFEVKLRTYNGQQLKRFLADSALYPSLFEVDTLIRRESEKRQRRLVIFKKEAVRGNKGLTYLIYGGVLLAMAWYKIGYVYWNMGFGFFMLGLAAISLWQKWPKPVDDEMVF